MVWVCVCLLSLRTSVPVCPMSKWALGSFPVPISQVLFTLCRYINVLFVSTTLFFGQNLIYIHVENCGGENTKSM